MNYKILLGVLLISAIVSCNPAGKEHDSHDEQQGHNHSEEVDDHEGVNDHEEVNDHEGVDDLEEVKFQYTAYSNSFELFAEADAFIAGEKANVLSHFSLLPSFKAVENGKISITLSVNGKETSQTLNEPTRKGIYSFNIQPEMQGTGKLAFEITNDEGTFEVVVPDVTVFTNKEDAHQASEKIGVSYTNTSVFTKEQSWKIEFATALPSLEPFGQVIKTTALVTPAQGNELVITAKTNGILLFNSGLVLEGVDVKAGQPLFTISGSNLSDNNISVKYVEAKSNFEKANANYKRAMELSEEKIVSEKELLDAENQYVNAKSIYDNISKDFSISGQSLKSPQSGFIKQLFVKNGEYVEAGQSIAVVTQDHSLFLNAEVAAKYAPILANIQTANIRSLYDKNSFSLEELNGSVLSYGKAANSDNYLIPLVLQIENNGHFVIGGFVELYLKTFSQNLTLVVPSTSLMEEQGNYFVCVQVTPELFEKREVFIGGTDGRNTEIVNGITASERIVTRGAMLIKLAQATGTLDAHSGHVH